MTDVKTCPDCGSELSALATFTEGTVAFCMGDCYEKKPGVEL